MLGRALIIFALAGLSAAVCPRRSIPEGRYCRFSLGVKLPIIEAMTACENLDAKYAVPANDTNTIIRADQAPAHLLKNERSGNTKRSSCNIVTFGFERSRGWLKSSVAELQRNIKFAPAEARSPIWRKPIDADFAVMDNPKVEDKDIPADECGDGWEKVFATKTCHKLLDGQAFGKPKRLIMIGKQKKWSPRHAIWIGGVQMNLNGANGFHWLDPAAGNITYSHYGLNEPAGARFCLFFGTHGFWGSEACSDVQQAFCQRPLGPPKVLADPKCEDGWIPCKQSQRCYKADAVAMDYVTAREHCLQQGADLATIHSFWENEAVIEAAAAVNSDKAWLGKRRNGDQWQWVNNEPHDFSIWHAGDVNTYIGDCAIVFGAVEATALAWLHRWDNVQCEQKYTPVCKKAPLQ
ncbi:unnamed protein product, partial [Mesorhabditis spiculigera]